MITQAEFVDLIIINDIDKIKKIFQNNEFDNCNRVIKKKSKTTINNF